MKKVKYTAILRKREVKYLNKITGEEVILTETERLLDAIHNNYLFVRTISKNR